MIIIHYQLIFKLFSNTIHCYYNNLPFKVVNHEHEYGNHFESHDNILFIPLHQTIPLILDVIFLIHILYNKIMMHSFFLNME